MDAPPDDATPVPGGADDGGGPGDGGPGDGSPREVGVGPWRGPWPTGPDAARYDPELLAGGDRRNVVDRYRYWSVEAVRADLAARSTTSTLLTCAGERAWATSSAGSSDQSTMSIFSPCSSAMTLRTRWPIGPMQAPFGLTPGAAARTRAAARLTQG